MLVVLSTLNSEEPEKYPEKLRKSLSIDTYNKIFQSLLAEQGE